MTNLPYPETEHYVKPDTQVGFMREMMRHYAAGEDSRSSIFAFLRIYGNSPLINGMRENAYLMNAVNAISHDNVLPTQPLDMHFYFGELLAAHTLLSTLSENRRRSLLRTDHFVDYRTETGYDFEPDDLETVVDSLIRWNDEGYNAALMSEPEEFQDALFDLTAHIYRDTVSNDEPFLFISGFMLCRRLMDATLKQCDLPDIPKYHSAL